ncbi:hypothetical protein QN382_08245 [Pseudomonas sp. 10B1]|uniref:hypothetical protein n=1 Tax=unclassified Pseudomonas TaxID=196821 RepID=UPI002AB4E321|nr:MULTISPECIES: hypothetical protein [unclassified Pseudomonas]MDY7559846.1 hypothetical protein [Pseudomonas sp. AB6]MEA9976559.1 hypothetical protein [Pseudomonas sp. RTS4]MEA9992911.1 hypothetical protein [Pseudomonas sp. AA4]MEB0089086.1 hypothetical protein [Pseudomonas sp. RTI1]MEB0125711.1 hypothetical protein [Pseudomonas sp. CCC1.2]
MSTELSEEEMREALFGPSSPAEPEPVMVPEPEVVVKPTPRPKPLPKSRAVSKPLSPKLRVTLHVTSEFEGEEEVFIYDANTLSTFVAEQEAKNEAKKKKFKYFEVISVTPIS